MVTNDERAQKYAEAFRDPGAFVERRRVEGVYPDSSRTARETLTEWQARAVMAVADAEQAELRAEIARVWRWFETDAAALRERAEAAEAKVARVDAVVNDEFGFTYDNVRAALRGDA